MYLDFKYPKFASHLTTLSGDLSNTEFMSSPKKKVLFLFWPRTRESCQDVDFSKHAKIAPA